MWIGKTSCVFSPADTHCSDNFASVEATPPFARNEIKFA
jgi:hypothetical protein